MRVQLMLGGESAIMIAARGRRATELQGKRRADRLSHAGPLSGGAERAGADAPGAHPHGSILFTDWMLSEEGQTVLAQQIPRMTLRNGVKANSAAPGSLQKRICLREPGSIGPNLNEDGVLPADL